VCPEPSPLPFSFPLPFFFPVFLLDVIGSDWSPSLRIFPLNRLLKFFWNSSFFLPLTLSVPPPHFLSHHRDLNAAFTEFLPSRQPNSSYRVDFLAAPFSSLFFFLSFYLFAFILPGTLDFDGFFYRRCSLLLFSSPLVSFPLFLCFSLFISPCCDSTTFPLPCFRWLLPPSSVLVSRCC